MRLFLRIPVPFLRIPVPFRRIPVDSGGITGFRTESVGHQKVQIPRWRGEARWQRVWVREDLKKDEIGQEIYNKEHINEVLTFFNVCCRVR